MREVVMEGNIEYYVMKQLIESFAESLRKYDKSIPDLPDDQVLEISGDLQAIIEIIGSINKITLERINYSDKKKGNTHK